ncbi:hypothetical protein CU097_005195 [Rhizopus azygosporus]|uniref:Uncharacterized protein n=1 Tax=Rhizopus azygosporus TaxID=86630 RepID=A0A367JGG9_RHIAZ|nr:hypothetical protein CU097_005195 [Rhizopus azygosporus]
MKFGIDQSFMVIFLTTYLQSNHTTSPRVIKSMKRLGLVEEDEHDVRLDFIFTNIAVAGLGDALFCEDQPTDKVSKKDETKPVT